MNEIKETWNAIALVEEGDEFVEESIMGDQLFKTKREAVKWFWKKNGWIETCGYKRSDYEVIKIEKTITRFGHVPKV